jgi:DNA replication protein DnaC
MSLNAKLRGITPTIVYYKTHLAIAIGYRAIQNGCETRFTTAAELIEDLSNASKKGRLQESLVTYTHPHVLVID